MDEPVVSSLATERTPLLAATGLRRVSRAGRLLLDDAQLRLDCGEVVALGGPSGSGKTVLQRALALLDPVTAGRIELAGAEPHDSEVPGYRRHVSFVHQRPVLVPGTVEENLTLSFELGVNAGRLFPRARAIETLERLGRDETFLAAGTRDLSGGEGQIVAITRTLLPSPTILLLDEPTASLDPTTAASFEKLIGDWVRAESPRAVLWVTHDEAQAERVADRQLWFESGRVIERASEA